MREDIERLLDEYKTNPDYFRKATILKILKQEKKVTTKELSRRLGMKASYVCHIVRLNKLPELVIDGYQSNLISISHLFIIARLKTPEQMAAAYEKVLEQSLTAVKTDGLIREMLYNIRGQGAHVPKEIVHELKEKIAGQGTNIDIKVIQTRIKAKIIIETWGNLEETSTFIRTIAGKIKGAQQ